MKSNEINQKLEYLMELKKQLTIAKTTLGASSVAFLGGNIALVANDNITLGTVVLASSGTFLGCLFGYASLVILWDKSVEKLVVCDKLTEQGVNIKEEIKSRKLAKKISKEK